MFRKSKVLIFGISVSLLAIATAMFITQGIPISHTNLSGHLVGNTGRKSSIESFKALINIFQVDVGMFDRPIRDLTQKARFYIFGLNAFGYHFLNAVILGLLIFMIYSFCCRYFNSMPLGLFASLLYICSPPVWHQIPTLEENSVLTELFVILAFFIFLRGFFDSGKPNSRKKKVFLNILILIITLLGVKTKGSAKIIFPVIFLFILTTDHKRLREYFWLLIGLFFVTVPVAGIVLKIFNPRAVNNEVHLSLAKVYRLIVINPDYSQSFGPSLIFSMTPFLMIMALAGLMVYILKRDSSGNKSPILDQAINPRERRMFYFLILWFLACAFLYSGYPIESEPRYLISALVPAAIIISFLIIKLYRGWSGRFGKIIHAGVIIFCFVAFILNTYKIYQLRAAHWSYWIAQENVKFFIEKTEGARGALVLGDIELETESQLNTTNLYIGRFYSQGEMDRAVKSYKEIFLVKHFSPLKKDIYTQRFKLIKIENGEGKTVFNFLKNRFSKVFKNDGKPGIAHEYYIYRFER